MTKKEMRMFLRTLDWPFFTVEMENEVDFDRPRPPLDTVNVEEPGTGVENFLVELLPFGG